MTSGTTVDDDTQLPPAPLWSGHQGKYGRYIRRYWTGADRPKIARQKPLRLPDTYVYVWVNGSRVLRRYRNFSRPPKRVRSASDGLHNYQMTGVRQYTSRVRVYNRLTGAFLGNATTNVLGSIITDKLWNNNDEIALVSKLRSVMNGSSFDASIFLGTSHQTLNLMADSTLKIYRSYRALRKGRLPEALEHLGVPATKHKSHARHGSSRSERVAQEWLGMQYGWLPLLSDIKAGAETVAHHVNSPMTLSYRAYHKHNGKPSDVFRSSDLDGTFEGGYHIEDGRIIAIFTEKPNVWRLEGLSDPLSLAWELTPWSFVLDWFLPVGDWLEARGFASGLQGTFVKTTRQKYGLWGIHQKPSSTRVYRIENAEPQASYFHSIEMIRGVSSSLSVPLPEFKPLGDVPSWKRAANAISLLISNGRRWSMTDGA